MINNLSLMKIRLFFVFLFLALISCSKKYEYTEFVRDHSVDSVYPVDTILIIKAKDDSSAYLKAFEKFCISQKKNMDLFDVTAIIEPTPDSFTLINPKGEEISNISFFSKVKKKEDIANKVFSGKRTVKEKRYSVDQ